LIPGLHRFFAGGIISRVRQAAIALTAFAIVSFVALGQTPDKSAAHSRSQAAAASGAASSGAPTKTIGNKSAPITLELFSDYQCPSCGGFFENTLRPMINTYVAEGKVFLVHHDFPLQMHTYSGQAARWANAAAKIGKFQEVDAALYDSQAKWPVDGDIGRFVAGAMTPADFKRVQAIMKSCSAPGPQAMFNNTAPQADHACLVDEYIVQDIVLGYQLPVPATPTFVIHYKGQTYPPTPAAVSWPILKQFFDTLLSQ
jgi:Thioredoxin